MVVESKNGAQRHKLTKKEVEDLIDREARKRLGFSGKEFVRKLSQGHLPETVAKRDIAMLVRLIDAQNGTQ